MRMTIPDDEARVIIQALSRCAAERRIAAAREVRSGVSTMLAGQAHEYESIIARRFSHARPSEGRDRSRASGQKTSHLSVV